MYTLLFLYLVLYLHIQYNYSTVPVAYIMEISLFYMYSKLLHILYTFKRVTVKFYL